MTQRLPKGLISLRAAAAALGVESKDPGRWLRRHVMIREREIGRPILVRVGKGTRRPTYRVNMDRLRIDCPELFDQGLGDVERAVRTLYRATQKQLEEIQEANEEVLANQNVLAESVRRLIDRRPAPRK